MSKWWSWQNENINPSIPFDFDLKYIYRRNAGKPKCAPLFTLLYFFFWIFRHHFTPLHHANTLYLRNIHLWPFSSLFWKKNNPSIWYWFFICFAPEMSTCVLDRVNWNCPNHHSIYCTLPCFCVSNRKSCVKCHKNKKQVISYITKICNKVYSMVPIKLLQEAHSDLTDWIWAKRGPPGTNTHKHT